MQLFALVGSETIFAEDAQKKQDYICPECGDILRIKEGSHRRKHFFHTNLKVECRQKNKNGIHLLVQKYIYSELPKDEAKLEYAFPAIHRIADVAWITQRIIFEVQYSPISLEEVQSRMEDYQKVGYSVIWILHDNRFNKKNLSAAESYLRNFSSYFTSIGSKKENIIYDQFELCYHAKRGFKGHKIPIQINNPKIAFSYPNPEMLPKALQKRLLHSKYYFGGDLLDRATSNNASVQWMFTTEREKPILPPIYHIWIRKIQNIYSLFFLHILKKLSEKN